MVTIEQLRAAYTAAVENGETNEQLATKLGIKLASLNQNLTTVRKDLRTLGVTDVELKEMFPPLKRRSGPRVSKRAAALLAMRDALRASKAPTNEVPVDGVPADEVPADEESDEPKAQDSHPHPNLMEVLTEVLSEIPA